MSKIKAIIDWCVKMFTSKDFVLAMPFAAFLLTIAIPTRFLGILCLVIWLFPLILGIHEETTTK